MTEIKFQKQYAQCKLDGSSEEVIKHSYLLFLLFIAFYLLSPVSFAQDDSTQQNIFLIARPTNDSIMLRWAPGNHTYWNLGNRYGYNLVRYTLMKDSVLIKNPQKYDLTPGGLKPWPINDWEQLVKTNKYGGIAAQAIFGETFEMDAGSATTPQHIIYKAKEQKQRFSFALYAADISPQVASASALWFTDHSAFKDEMYVYRIYLNLPDSLSKMNDTAFVFTGIRDYSPLPKPIELTAEFGDRTAVLSWNTFVQSNIYIAWEVERSGNGKDFDPLTIDPKVSVMPSENANTEYTYKYDSLPSNNKEFFYRVRGITSFGEYGPWSDMARGKGLEAINAVPNITGHEIIHEKVMINWEFPSENERFISGFKIMRSTNHKTGFKELKSKLKPSHRSFSDKKPMGTNYYKIVAYRDSMANKSSFPYMVQLTDNTPPDKPKGLHGLVDSSGIVTLKWKPNNDSDIYGYRVFRSASGNDEFSQKTHRPVADTFYIDTLSNKDLNTRIFYKILAIDLRQNQSEFSDVAELLKPDNIPPSIPVITNTQATPEGIQLTWINSTSTDVSAHNIYRLLTSDTVWTRLAEIPYNKKHLQSTYTDTECSTKSNNQYKIVALDTSGNMSNPSLSIALIGLKNLKRPALVNIQKKMDIENGRIYLNWQLPDNPVSLIKVYRKTNEKGYALIETLEGSATVFEDYGMKIGSSYAYRLKMIFTDGAVSPFSNQISIHF